MKNLANKLDRPPDLHVKERPPKPSTCNGPRQLHPAPEPNVWPMKFCRPIRKVTFNPYDAPGNQLPFLILGPNSPLTYRKAARLLAEDFANGAHFSPAPYEAEEVRLYGGKYSSDRVLLFAKPATGQKIRCFGALGVRWQKFDDVPDPGWFMTWAWLHPAEQRQGHLIKAWPYILKLFPT